jgi:hypothetical protein
MKEGKKNDIKTELKYFIIFRCKFKKKKKKKMECQANLIWKKYEI